MIIRNNQRNIRTKDNLFSGEGTVMFNDIVDKSELYDKGSMFSELILKENCGLGYHTHTDEEEILLITKGKGVYNDDGQVSEVFEGDVCVCKDGHSHSIMNKSKEDMIAVAIKINK